MSGCFSVVKNELSIAGTINFMISYPSVSSYQSKIDHSDQLHVKKI